MLDNSTDPPMIRDTFLYLSSNLVENSSLVLKIRLYMNGLHMVLQSLLMSAQDLIKLYSSLKFTCSSSSSLGFQTSLISCHTFLVFSGPVTL